MLVSHPIISTVIFGAKGGKDGVAIGVSVKLVVGVIEIVSVGVIVGRSAVLVGVKIKGVGE